jgi:hypothetical protein
MDPNTRLTSAQSPSTTEEIAAMRHVPYHEAVGSLMYATLGTRPDICFAVQTVSRFNSKPGLAHWEAVKRIFQYLKGTKELWLAYGDVTKELVGYANADGSMSEDRKAISGYAFLINGGAVSWSTKRQKIISLSKTESEYIAILCCPPQSPYGLYPKLYVCLERTIYGTRLGFGLGLGLGFMV